MNKYKNLEYLANGFHAANEIRELYNSNLINDNQSSVLQGDLERLNRVLGIIKNYYPNEGRHNLNEVIDKSNLYCDTYRTLKQNIKSKESTRVTKDSFVNTLLTLEPVLNNKQRGLVDKIVKLSEVFS